MIGYTGSPLKHMRLLCKSITPSIRVPGTVVVDDSGA